MDKCEIIYKCNKKNIIIDIEILQELINIFLDELNIKSFLTIDLVCNYKEVLSVKKNSLLIDERQYSKFCQYLQNTYKDIIIVNNKIIEYVLKTLFVVKMKYEKYDNSIYNDIILLSKMGLANNNSNEIKNFIEMNNQVLPIERISKLKAIDKMIKDYEENCNLFLNEIDNCKIEKYVSTIEGYYLFNDIYIGPTISLFKNLDLTKAMEAYPWYDEDFKKGMEKQKRLIYVKDREELGLNLTKKEYDSYVKNFR